MPEVSSEPVQQVRDAGGAALRGRTARSERPEDRAADEYRPGAKRQRGKDVLSLAAAPICRATGSHGSRRRRNPQQ